MKFKIEKFYLDTSSGEMLCGTQAQKFRSKSLQVLCYLVEHRQRVVSKQELLSSIWDDVVVEEHVLFQSIGEIRALFEDKSVIKTLPRKGYQWVAPLTCIDESDLSSDLPLTNSSETTRFADSLSDSQASTQAKDKKWRTSQLYWIPSGLSALLIGAFAFFFSNVIDREARFPFPPGTIAILPISSELDESQHNWIRLGGMDLINEQLSQTDLKVIPSADILTALRNTGSLPIIDPDDGAFQLRTVLGVNTVVHIRLLDAPMGYQAHYKLMHKNVTQRGVVINDNIPILLQKIAQKIAYKFEKQPLDPIYDAQRFADETLLVGLENFIAEKYHEAESLFSSALALNSSQLSTHTFLIQSFIAQGKLEEAEQSANKLLEISKQKSSLRFRLRANTLLAQIHTHRRNYQLASDILDSSSQWSESLGDRLYLAMTYLEMGKFAASQNDRVQAEHYFNTSLSLHDSSRSGYGKVSVLYAYSQMLIDQGDYEQAQQMVQRALKTADDFAMPRSKALVLIVLADIYMWYGRQKEALQIVNQAEQQLHGLAGGSVMHQVDDWYRRHNLVHLKGTAKGVLFSKVRTVASTQ